MIDPILRGSGELLYQIKARALSPQEVFAFAQLLWSADSSGKVAGYGCPESTLAKFEKLLLLSKLSDGRIMLNPHVSQIGDAKRRGQLRKEFIKSLEA